MHTVPSAPAGGRTMEWILSVRPVVCGLTWSLKVSGALHTAYSLQCGCFLPTLMLATSADTAKDYQIADFKRTSKPGFIATYQNTFSLKSFLSFTDVIRIHWQELLWQTLSHIFVSFALSHLLWAWLQAVIFVRHPTLASQVLCARLGVSHQGRRSLQCSQAFCCSLEIKSIWNRNSILRFFLYK